MNLSTTDIGILRLLARGMGQNHIASAIGETHAQVRGRVAKMREQTGARTTVQLVAIATAKGLLGEQHGR
jgi:DNA-binding NarL/FixJ family response regulator